MKKTAAILVLLAAAPVAAEEVPHEDEFATALVSGDLSLGVRARYEFVDQDGFDKDANATTTRLRLNYKTAEWNKMTAFVEFDHAFNVLLSDYNSGAGTSPNRTEYPVVADPDGSDLNQFYIDYAFDQDWKIRLGRQRTLLDNQRFVGGVGWRQNEQTYDAVSVTTTALENATIFYSYITQVRRIFGQTVSAGKANVDTHLLNLKFRINDNWSITPYAYLIDDHDVPVFSTSTFGARIAGNVGLGAGTLALLGEFATQSDAGDAPVSYDADYSHLTATWSDEAGLTIGLGLETLGGSTGPGEAFRTPMATLHAFNGWADKFIATPAAGLKDTYVTFKVPFGDWKFTAIYHDFAAETGSGDFGNEFNVSASRKLSDRYSLLLKGAFFSADSAAAVTDTTKIWVMFTANY